MYSDHKLLSFIITLKRQRKNSIILNDAEYRMAKNIGLSPVTLKKYLRLSIEKGWISTVHSVETRRVVRYKVIRFQDILKDFYSETGLAFASHEIIQGKSKKFNAVLAEVMEHLALDNTIAQQEFKIKKKKRVIDIVCNQTGFIETRPGETKRIIKEYTSQVFENASCVGTVEQMIDYNQKTFTSARHLGEKIGVSTPRANKILNSLKTANRRIVSVYINGANFESIEKAHALYPGRLIYSMMSINKTKVCFGSQITRNGYTFPTNSSVFSKKNSGLHTDNNSISMSM